MISFSPVRVRLRIFGSLYCGEIFAGLMTLLFIFYILVHLHSLMGYSHCYLIELGTQLTPRLNLKGRWFGGTVVEKGEKNGFDKKNEF